MNFSPTPAATVGPGGQAVSDDSIDQPWSKSLSIKILIDNEPTFAIIMFSSMSK
jgi:hypothetical protein